MKKEHIWLFIKEITDQTIYDLIDIATFNLMCPDCLEFNTWENWIENWIPLDEAEFGVGAVHIRAECPECHVLYDHKDKMTLEFGT